MQNKEEKANPRLLSRLGTAAGFRILWVATLFVWSSLALLFAITASPTSDEFPYFGDGLAVLHRHDYRMDPEHPPLMKMLTALPVYLLNRPNMEAAEANGELSPWYWGYQGPYGFFLLFRGDDQPVMNRVLLGRLMPIAVGLLGGLLAAWWGRQLGRTRLAGICAAAFLLFYPEYLGHACFMVLDAPLLVACAIVSAAAWRWWKRPGPLAALLFILACSIASFVKLPGAVFAAITAVILLIRPLVNPAKAGWLRSAGLLAGLLLGLYAAAWAAYGFRYDAMPPGASVMARNRLLPPIVIDMKPSIRSLVNHIWELGLLPEASLAPLANVGMFENKEYFLLGEYGSAGWYHYFLVTFLLKSTPALLAAALLLAIGAGRTLATPPRTRAARWRFQRHLLLWLPFALLFLLVAKSRVNLGHRYILFIYFPLAVSAGVLCAQWLAAGGWRRPAAALLLAAHLASAAIAYPHFSTYFNFLAGNPYRASRYLRDSNADWGQDVLLLSAWLRQQGIESVNLALFGLNEPEGLGITNYRWIDPKYIFPIPLVKPTTPDPALPSAISVNELHRMRALYPQLYDREPDVLLNSIVVFLPEPSPVSP